MTSPAQAEVVPAQWSLSGEAGVVSDYRFRGISLSGRDPAVQGGLTVEHASGLYAGVWGSTIAETGAGADAEIDLLAGYATNFGGADVDLSVTYYAYPSDPDINYVEAIATAAFPLGTLKPMVGVGYAPKQGNLRDELGAKRDNLYLFGGLEYPIEDTPVTLNAQAGYETGYFDARDVGGKWDWQVGASLEVADFNLGLTYVDSNAKLLDQRGRNTADRTVIVSVLLSF